jgi:hypothetical protein
LKLQYDEPLSNFAFNFNLRRYNVEYIRRDIEGSDSDTRRRGACELVKGLTAKFPDVMTQSVTGYVTALLAGG